MTLARRTRIALAIAVALVSVLSVAVINEMIHMAENRRSVTEVYLPTVRSLAIISNSVTSIEIAMASRVSGATIDRAQSSELLWQESDQAFNDALGYLTDQPELAMQVQQLSERWRTWYALYVKPCLAQVDPVQATPLCNLPLGVLDVEQIMADLVAVEEQVEGQVRELLAASDRISRMLTITLLALGTTVLLFAAGTAISTQKWVITPLQLLGDQLRALSHGASIHRPIVASGPPELHQAGQSVESLRQHLVFSIDSAQASAASLAQEGPVVELIRGLLQPTLMEPLPGLVSSAVRLPADGVLAGDWWDAEIFDSSGSALAISDIAGHGPGAGVSAVRFKSVLMSSIRRRNTVIQALENAGAVFVDQPGRFATCIVARFTPATLRWINAGHLPPILLRADGTVDRLNPTGPIVSALPGEWIWSETPFRPGDLLVMFTDGLTEARTTTGGDIGDELIIAWTQELAHRSRGQAAQSRCDYISNGLLGKARDLTGGKPADDITIVTISRS